MKRCAGDSYVACNPRTSLKNRAAKARILLCVVALCALLATSASAQVLWDTLVLPDTFGPLPGPLHMAYDDDSTHARLYFGGEADIGGVLVVDLLTCEKLARIATGPVRDVALNAPRGKLYVARDDTDSILVVDDDSYGEVGRIGLPCRPLAMVYNQVNDRIYAVGSNIAVIDCAGDTVVSRLDPLPGPGSVAVLALDTLHNKLYVGSEGATYVVDCGSDSITAMLPGLRGPGAMVINPVASKLYYTATDTLFVVATATDSIRARMRFTNLNPLLACDPMHGRTYFQNGTWFTAIDCATDSIIYSRWRYPPATGLECDPVSDRVYYQQGGTMHLYDGGTLVRDTILLVDGGTCRLRRLPTLGFMVVQGASGTTHVFDCRSDSLIGTVVTISRPGDVCVGAGGSKLYVTGSCDITVVDCSLNIVTTHIQSQATPFTPVYSAAYNRLYVTCSDSLVSVYDCAADTLLRRIPVTESKNGALYHTGLRKLYVYEGERAWEPETIDVIQCGPDTVCGAVPLPSDAEAQVFLVPEFNQLWYLGLYHLIIVDCFRDSIVIDTLPDWGTISSACVSAEDRKVYLARYSDSLRIIRADSLTWVRTVAGTGNTTRSPLLYIPAARKVYWFAAPYIWVVDTRTDSVVNKVDCGVEFHSVSLDRTGTYVYGLGEWDTLLYCIDSRSDSIISRSPLPFRPWQQLVRNDERHSIYFEAWAACPWMPVFRDSIVKTGVNEFSPFYLSPSQSPTVVRRSSGLRVPAESEVFDAAGRVVGNLKPGPNSLSGLRAGIYFISERCRALAGSPGAARRFVLVE